MSRAVIGAGDMAARAVKPVTRRPAPKRLVREDVPPLHTRVVAQLRSAIVDGTFKAGERLIEERLAEQLGVSRIPVRQAILVLAAEGLVELSARRGASVATLSAREAREIIEIRALLEGHNARLAARGRNPKLVKGIKTVLAKGTAAMQAGRFDLLATLNQRFHHELALAGENEVLAELLIRMRDRTETLFAPTLPERQRRAWEQHAAILRAIIDGDEHAAATLAAKHVTAAGEDFLARTQTGAANKPTVAGSRRAKSAATALQSR
jgi:DNA-binding GntR family transcriptional regulator